MWRNWNLVHCWWKRKMVSCCGKVWQLLENLNIKLPSNATARCVPKKTEGRRQVLRHPSIYRWNNNQLVEKTRRSPPSGWRNKTWSMYTRNSVWRKKTKRRYMLRCGWPSKNITMKNARHERSRNSRIPLCELSRTGKSTDTKTHNGGCQGFRGEGNGRWWNGIKREKLMTAERKGVISGGEFLSGRLGTGFDAQVVRWLRLIVI